MPFGNSFSLAQCAYLQDLGSHSSSANLHQGVLDLKINCLCPHLKNWQEGEQGLHPSDI
jgi:hypothetical protein